MHSNTTKSPAFSDDDESDDDTNGRPVSLEEMRLQTAEKMNRVENAKSTSF